MTSDYTTVTEAPGVEVTSEAVKIIYSRYAFALPYCQGNDILEVACGGGLGLGLLAQKARQVVAGDLTVPLLSQARRRFGHQVPILVLDAHRLPFRDQSFDVVILFEALYYLADPLLFLKECRRLLKPNGRLLLSTVNKEHAGFAPSPFSVSYHSARQLRDLFTGAGFEADIFGSFFSEDRGSDLTLAIRRLAVSLSLIPNTMRAKAVLKRLFYGRLISLPEDIAEAETEVEPWAPLKEPWQEAPSYKFLYAAARLA